MRDVLYKAKRSDNGEWIEGGIVERDGKAYIVGISKSLRIDGIEVDPNTICQFTGLYDSTKFEELSEVEQREFLDEGNMSFDWKGKKIWENDVLHLKTRPKVRQQTEFLTTVDWDAYCAGFMIEDDEEGGAVGLDAITENGIYEIIENLGSIFDNPELLERQV